jgi:hypothetical protein
MIKPTIGSMLISVMGSIFKILDHDRAKLLVPGPESMLDIGQTVLIRRIAPISYYRRRDLRRWKP